MKIALLHPSLTWHGGAERQILNLALELQRRNHKVEIFTTAIDANCFSEVTEQLTIHTVHARWIKSQSIRQKRTLSTRLAGRLQEYTVNVPSMVLLAKMISKDFDLINCHNTPTQWAAFFAKRKLDASIVWNCNEPPFWYAMPKNRSGLGKLNLPLYAGLDRKAVSYIDCIVANSFVDAERIQRAYGRSSFIVRPGVNGDMFHKASGAQVRSKYGFEKAIVLLQVGNFATDKQQSESIRALSYVSKRFENVKLILLGAGSKDGLVHLSKRLGVDQKVLFLQKCSDLEIAELYAACDIFIFPAQITWGLAVLEAMASSKPVIVSKEAGVSEIIHNGKNGVVVEQPYANTMAKEVEKLIVHEDIRLKLGCNAYEFIKETKTLSWAAYAEKMESIFQNAVENYRKPINCP